MEGLGTGRSGGTARTRLGVVVVVAVAFAVGAQAAMAHDDLVTISNGILTYTPVSGAPTPNNQLTISLANDNGVPIYEVNDPGSEGINIAPGTNCFPLDPKPLSVGCKVAGNGINSIFVRTAAGINTITITAPLPAVIHPGNGTSTVYAGPARGNQLFADNGNADIHAGSGGGNVLNGGPGMDTLRYCPTNGDTLVASTIGPTDTVVNTCAGPGPPSVSISTPANGASLTQGQVVNAAFSCQAGANGVLKTGTDGCSGPVPNGSPIDTSTPGQHTFSVTATDTDGQATTATSTYTVAAAAAGPPSASIATPANGASFTQGQVVNAAFSCQAGANGGVLQTGTNGCSGPVPNGSPIDTPTPGQHSFSVTATDTDGQAATATSTYTVRAAPPQSNSPPTIAGQGKAGIKVSCSQGSWSNTPTSYSYKWERGGTPIDDATSSTYVVQAGDEGLGLTCTVTASNSAGPGQPATSAPLGVPVPSVAHCPAATGSLGGLSVGLVRLGMTSQQARRAYKGSFDRRSANQDDFCLTPAGIAVYYASTTLLNTLPPLERDQVKGRVIVALTANSHYVLNGVRPGATITMARQALRTRGPLHIGGSDWYLAPNGRSTAVLEVRGGIVEQIGIADKGLTKTDDAAAALLNAIT